MIEASFLHSTV